MNVKGSLSLSYKQPEKLFLPVRRKKETSAETSATSDFCKKEEELSYQFSENANWSVDSLQADDGRMWTVKVCGHELKRKIKKFKQKLSNYFNYFYINEARLCVYLWLTPPFR